MSRLSPGNGTGFMSRVARLPIVLFAAAIFISAQTPASGAEEKPNEQGSSGVVAPKVSKLSPRVTKKDLEIEEYTLPEKYCYPYGIAIGADDRVWITEMAGNSLAVFDPATGELKEYRIPSTVGLPESDWEYDPQNRTAPEEAMNVYSVGGPGNMTIDKDGIVWFVMQLGNSICRFDPAREEFTEFIIPTENALPYDIVADSRGRIWFVEKNSGKLGYLDYESKKVFEIDLGKGTNMMGVTVDKDDNIWIGDVSSNMIARYNPETKKLRQFTINVQNSQPGQMRFDKDGRLWICHLRSQHLGVLIPDPGVHSVVPLPGYNSVPQGLAPAGEGRIWIVDSMMNRVGFFDGINLKWRLFSIPTMNAQPMNMAIDSKGDIWFTESDRNANSIARIRKSSVENAVAMQEKEEKAFGRKEAAAVSQPGAAEPGGGGVKTIGVVVAVLVVVIAGFSVIRRSRRKR